MDDSEKQRLGVSYWDVTAGHTALLTLIVTNASI